MAPNGRNGFQRRINPPPEPLPAKSGKHLMDKMRFLVFHSCFCRMCVFMNIARKHNCWVCVRCFFKSLATLPNKQLKQSLAVGSQQNTTEDLVP